MVAPPAKSLVLDLLSTVPHGAMPVRLLVEAAALFGIAENALRVALARLLAAGLVTRDERGRYGMGPAADAVAKQVAAWRRSEGRVRGWQGGWIGVHTGGVARADRAALRRRVRALRFLGLRELSPGLEVRPDNLAGDVAVVRDALQALGLERGVPVFRLADLDPETDARARALWPAAAIVAGYQRARALLAQSQRRLPTLSPERAMTESFLLGGQAIRQLALDPLLPEPIVPARERALLVDALRAYDRAGRTAWAALLRRHGALPPRTPADLRLDHPAAGLAVAGGHA